MHGLALSTVDLNFQRFSPNKTMKLIGPTLVAVAVACRGMPWRTNTVGTSWARLSVLEGLS